MFTYELWFSVYLFQKPENVQENDKYYYYNNRYYNFKNKTVCAGKLKVNHTDVSAFWNGCVYLLIVKFIKKNMHNRNGKGGIKII
jgi:hypothetical protein